MGSIYGIIFSYISLLCMVNVGINIPIHGSYGYGNFMITLGVWRLHAKGREQTGKSPGPGNSYRRSCSAAANGKVI